jgi:hypothetical protein
MMDLMYFGYEYDNDATKLQAEFINDIKEKFDNVILKNAYDSIKGYRQEVHLSDELEDDYLVWLIAEGWLEMSITMQIMMMDKDRKEEFDRIWKLAKERHPEAFKEEAIETDVKKQLIEDKLERKEDVLQLKKAEYAGLDQITASDTYGQKLYDKIQELKGEIKSLKWVLENYEKEK